MIVKLTDWYLKSFRNKLVTAILGIFFVVYSLMLHWAYSTMSADLLLAAKKESISTSAILVMALYRSFDLETDKREILSFLLGSKQYRQNLTLIRVFNSQQMIVSSTNIDEIGQSDHAIDHQEVLSNLISTKSLVKDDLPYLQIFYPISAGPENKNRAVGFIEAHYDISAYALALSNLRGYFISGGLLMALGMTLALTKIASSMTEPMRCLYDAMKQVEDDRLDIRVPVLSQDEVGFLSLKFNRMIEALASSRDGLKQLVDASSCFVPDEFLQMLGRERITEVALGDAQHLKLTVLFLDIRDFTRLSSNLTADQVLEFLNLLNQYLIPCIQFRRGFVDKYIGDAIMAIFPHSPDDAVNASSELIAALARFNQDKLLAHIPEIDLGVGINCGDVIIGTVGAKQRMDTTVIGDTVNLASRMESLTKQAGVRILMTGIVYQQLSSSTIEAHQIKWVGQFQVKGIADAVMTYGMQR